MNDEDDASSTSSMMSSARERKTKRVDRRQMNDNDDLSATSSVMTSSTEKKTKNFAPKLSDARLKTMGHVELYYYHKYGLTELPKGTENMGSYDRKVYTTEQQARLGVDKEGNRIPLEARRRTSKLLGTLRSTSSFRSVSTQRMSPKTPNNKSQLMGIVDEDRVIDEKATGASITRQRATRSERKKRRGRDEASYQENVRRESTQKKKKKKKRHHRRAQIDPIGKRDDSDDVLFDRQRDLMMMKTASATMSDSNDTEEDDASSVDDSRHESTKPRPRRYVVHKLWIDAQMSYQIHRLSSEYFGFWNFWFMVVPCVLVTMLAGIFAFVSHSHLIESDSTRRRLAITVGVLSFLGTILQCIAHLLGLSTRAKMHGAASLEFQRIVNEMNYQSVRKCDVERTRMLLEQALRSCQSVPPLKISQAFQVTEARLTQQTYAHESALKSTMKENHRLNVYSAITHELYCAVSNFRLWPLMIPRACNAADAAFRSFRDPLERNIARGKETEKYKSLTISDLFSVKRARSSRVSPSFR